MYLSSTRSLSPHSPYHMNKTVVNHTIWEEPEEIFLKSPIKTTYDFFCGSGQHSRHKESQEVVSLPLRRYKSLNKSMSISAKSESSQTTTEDMTKSTEKNSRSPRKHKINKDRNKTSRDVGVERKASRSSRSSISGLTSKSASFDSTTKGSQDNNDVIYLQVIGAC